MLDAYADRATTMGKALGLDTERYLGACALLLRTNAQSIRCLPAWLLNACMLECRGQVASI
jgi:hypothetical protein